MVWILVATIFLMGAVCGAVGVLMTLDHMKIRVPWF